MGRARGASGRRIREEGARASDWERVREGWGDCQPARRTHFAGDRGGFGEPTAEEVRRSIPGSSGRDRIALVAAAILDCDTREEFLDRVRGRGM